MVRGSELAFRKLAQENGASLVYSPMLRDHDVLSVAAAAPEEFSSKPLTIDSAGRTSSVAETAYLLLSDTHPSENLVIQLCGHSPIILAKATTAILDVRGASIVLAEGRGNPSTSPIHSWAKFEG